MGTRPGQKIKMTSIDELLCVPETQGTIDIDIRAIYPFENHPFKVVDDEKMDELVDSIKAKGILTPVIVRPDDEGTYEMISGHRRLHAAERAGLTKIPAVVKEMTNDDAIIYMVDANIQREEILPSERAFSMKMKLEAIRRQGARTDLTSGRNEQKLDGVNSRDIIAKENGMSGTAVSRYIRLTELIDEILQLVDEKRVPIYTGVEISYFTRKIQKWIYQYIRDNGVPKTVEMTELRTETNQETLTQEELISFLNGLRPVSTESCKITLTKRKLNRYFPAYMSRDEREKVIYSLLQKWKEEQEAK